MDLECEELILQHKNSIERLVFYKVNSKFDAEDILQEVFMSAILNFTSLLDKSKFKAWLISIANNKILDYYRASAKKRETPLLDKHENIADQPAEDIFDGVLNKHRNILEMHYIVGLSVEEIAQKLSLPAGTVKSRLFTARQHFKSVNFDFAPPKTKGEIMFKNMPKVLPNYTIEKNEKPPFAVEWKEILGWFAVPQKGEKLAWAMYDFPERKITELVEMKENGKASVHAIEGVVISAKCRSIDGEYNAGEESTYNFVAKLTDTHCQTIAESHLEDGVTVCHTFLDDEFLRDWGVGENNIGNSIFPTSQGIIVRDKSQVTTTTDKSALDVVGRYQIEINNKKFDTICIMFIDEQGTATEQYIDKNGRTVLWRRFNSDTWQFESKGKKWSEILPKNQQITINNKIYIHWYDCITDKLLN